MTSSGTQFEIVPAQLEHAESYVRAVDSVARERRYLARFEGPSLEKARAFIRLQQEKDWPNFVAMAEGAVVGWCNIVSFEKPVFAHAGSLGIGVIKDYRECGIGPALMEAALQKAKEIGLTRVELEVREENHAAIRLYEKFGFVREGLKRNASFQDGVYSHDLIMAVLFGDAVC